MNTLHEYKIVGLLDDKFLDYEYWNIDFRRHLKPDIALAKNVFYLANGRPDYAEYSYEGEPYAKLKWTFTNIPNSGLMATRKEEVAYYKLDGTLGSYFKIKDDTWDMGEQHHRIKVMKERISGREFIVEDMEISIYGMLQLLYPSKTETELSAMGGQFFAIHNVVINSFIKSGDDGLLAAITADSTITWLDDYIDIGVTIRNYIQSRLTY